MQLAQNTFGITETTVSTPAPGAAKMISVGTSLFGLLVFPATILLCVVLWIIALVQVSQRSDLHRSKSIYFLLLILLAPVGMLLYFFSEQRKSYGWIMLIALGLSSLLLIAGLVAGTAA